MKKSTLPHNIKDRGSKCVAAKLMSSEENDDDNDAIVVKPLPWIVDNLTEFLHILAILNVESKTCNRGANARNE